MLQFLIKEQTKKKREFSSRGPCIPGKDKGKRKENEPHTPPGRTGGEEHDEHDSHS